MAQREDLAVGFLEDFCQHVETNHGGEVATTRVPGRKQQRQQQDENGIDLDRCGIRSRPALSANSPQNMNQLSSEKRRNPEQRHDNAVQ